MTEKSSFKSLVGLESISIDLKPFCFANRWMMNGLTWCGSKNKSSDGINYDSCPNCSHFKAFWGLASRRVSFVWLSDIFRMSAVYMWDDVDRLTGNSRITHFKSWLFEFVYVAIRGDFSFAAANLLGPRSLFTPQHQLVNSPYCSLYASYVTYKENLRDNRELLDLAKSFPLFSWP